MTILHHTLREIERKFAFNIRLLPVVLCNGGKPPFRELAGLKFSSIHDTYFDNAARALSKNPATSGGAVWLRKRQSQWQAKVTQSGDKDFKRVTYNEIHDLGQIQALVEKLIPPSGGAAAAAAAGPEADFGLLPYCDYTTYRTEFTADGRFNVALDVTDFGHDVGEVEVLAPAATTTATATATATATGGGGGGGGGPEEESRKVLEEIEGFMDKYRWLFRSGQGEPKGKMSAYFEKFGGW